MNHYWVMKMGCFFNFVTGWTADVPEPMSITLARIVAQENFGAIIVGGES